MFFLTEGQTDIVEERLVGFEVIADGTMHTDELDMSEIETWDGFITALRYDPVTTPGTSFTIESITVG